MDSINAGGDFDTDRWMKLGNLGLENALFQLQSAEEGDGVARILDWLRRSHSKYDNQAQFYLDSKDAACVLLAALGRNSDITGTGSFSTTENLCVADDRVYIIVEGAEMGIFFSRFAIGERELGVLWVNLAKNPKIKRLTIYSKHRVFEDLANLDRFKSALTSNTFLQHLNFHMNCEAWVDPLQNWASYTVFRSSINDYERRMTKRTLEHLMTFLGKNESLESFGIMVFSEDIDWIADVVAATTTLRGLSVIYLLPATGKGEVGGDVDVLQNLANALRKNTSLKSFRFAAFYQYSDLHTTKTRDWAGPSTLLAAFTQEEEEESQDNNHRQGSPNCTINQLSFPDVPSSAVGILCSMLRTNKTLKELRLNESCLSPQEWTKILGSLRGNDTLEHLDLKHCLGLTENIVFDPLMSLLQHTNTGLKEILLSGTDLQLKQGVIDEELRVNREWRTGLASEDRIVPRAGRIVLCGYPFAGKTRIRQTLQRQEMGAVRWKGILQRHPRLRQLLFAKGVHQELYNRTRGLDIIVMGKAPETTSIWDFGGQEAFYALHDYVFPNAGNSCFLYICSVRHPPNNEGDRPVKEECDIQDEFRYWMRFIGSNSKRLKDPQGQIQRPSVTFVMTHLDTLNAREQLRLKSVAEAVVDDFRAAFKTLLDISDTTEFIDARFLKPVENLFDVSKSRLAKTLAVSTEYKVCSMVRDALQLWRRNHPSELILTLKSVGEICAHGDLRGQLQNLGERGATVLNNSIEQTFETGLKIVLKYLSDIGDIIFVEGLNFIIVQVTWFGSQVLGYLIDPFQGSCTNAGTGILGCFRKNPVREDAWTPRHKNGFVHRSALDRFLERSLKGISFYHGVPFGNLIDLMINLEMCFEEVPEHGEKSSDLGPRFFFPALLGGGSQKVTGTSEALKWEAQLSSTEWTNIGHVGRRLECKDKLLTFLSPGFFPRLQVVLVKYFRGKNWLDTKHFKVLQNMVRFATDGMEIIVEYSDTDFFVDILVRSTKTFHQTLEFIQGHVERKILEFCSSPQGCPGVDLVEGVIRPRCVELLSGCKERKDQSVLVSDLENKNPDYKHTWKVEIAGVSDYDGATQLLCAYPMAEVSTKFYFTIKDVEAIQKLEANMNSAKKIPVKLHILCDGTHNGPHQIDRQPGRVLQVPESCKDFNVHILKFAFNMLYEGAKIAGGFFNVQFPDQLDRSVEKLCKPTPDLDIDLDTLKRIANIEDKSGRVPAEDILKELNKYLRVCPDTEWLKQFLNVEDHSAFRRDFQLRKARIPSTGDVWLCKKHFEELSRSCR